MLAWHENGQIAMSWDFKSDETKWWDKSGNAKGSKKYNKDEFIYDKDPNEEMVTHLTQVANNYHRYTIADLNKLEIQHKFIKFFVDLYTDLFYLNG